MLYKNGKLYELKEREINLVHSKLNLPVRIVYTKEQIRKNKLNPIPDKPASINIPLKVNLKTEHGFVEMRYAENIVQNAEGKIKYTPHSFSFFGDRLLTVFDIEFIWLSVKRNVTKVNTMIYDLNVGLSEEKLRRIAKAYFIPNIDSFTRSQVELVLEDRVFAEERSKKNGLKRFLQMANADEELETKGKIQTAIDRKIIKYLPQRKMWMWIDEKGKASQEVCRITGGKSPYEALHDWMMGNDEFKDALDDHLKGQTVIAKKKEEVLKGDPIE
jgi:hypothetical protein